MMYQTVIPRVIPEKCFAESAQYSEKSQYCQQFFYGSSVDIIASAFIVVALIATAWIMWDLSRN